jgi:hypothetical protein
MKTVPTDPSASREERTNSRFGFRPGVVLRNLVRCSTRPSIQVAAQWVSGSARPAMHHLLTCDRAYREEHPGERPATEDSAERLFAHKPGLAMFYAMSFEGVYFAADMSNQAGVRLLRALARHPGWGWTKLRLNPLDRSSHDGLPDQHAPIPHATTGDEVGAGSAGLRVFDPGRRQSAQSTAADAPRGSPGLAGCTPIAGQPGLQRGGRQSTGAGSHSPRGPVDTRLIRMARAFGSSIDERIHDALIPAGRDNEDNKPWN